jgi:subfamily B ATP-binding cassette protein MsbA
MRRVFKHLTELYETLRALRPHLRVGRFLALATCVTSFISSLLEGVAIGLMVPLVELLQPESQAAMGAKAGGGSITGRILGWLGSMGAGDDQTSRVIALCLLVLGAIAAKNLVLYASWLLGGRLKRRATCHLRDALFTRIQHANLAVFEQRMTGEVAQVFHTETTRVTIAIDYLIMLLQRVSMLLVYVALILYYSWQLTLGVIGLAAFVASLVGWLHLRLARRGREASQRHQRLGALLGEAFGGIRVIRATNSQDRECERFRSESTTLGQVEEQATRSNALLIPVAETGAVFGAMLLIAGAYLVLLKPGRMASADLYACGLFLLRLLPLLSQTYSLYGQLLYLSGGLKEIRHWVELPEFPQRPFGNREFQSLQTGVRFEKLTFQYPNGTTALRDLDLAIPAGKTIALVGTSGSGKSTAAGLLLRLREPTQGRITADGVDYWEFSPASWHRQVGFVEQEAFLFHDTIERNVAYGLDAVSRERVLEALRLAQLEELVISLPQGIDTVVGERGASLSGGQRQRLAIARALVRDPKLLILDEATSALDNVSERQVQAALEAAQRGRTSLVIAHRLTTIRRADWIVVLENGRKVEEGKWADLVSRSGPFSRLLAAASEQRPTTPGLDAVTSV